MVKRLECNARDCDRKFTPRVRTQLYCSVRCKNREAQKRLAKRLREAALPQSSRPAASLPPTTHAREAAE